MNYTIALDVAPDPVSPWSGMATVAIIGGFLGMIVWEGGVLALFGMRPVDKAFVTSFLANMAACAVGFVMFIVATAAHLQGAGAASTILLAIFLMQGLMLSKNPVNLSKPRAWIAAFTMKIVSVLVFGLLLYFINY